MVKSFQYAPKSRDCLAQGIEEVYKLVVGNTEFESPNVIVEDENKNLLLSPSPYYILRNLKSPNLDKDLGIQMAKTAVLNTIQNVGGGAALTMQFMYKMIQLAMPLIASDASPILLRKGLKKAYFEISKDIEAYKKPVSSDELAGMLKDEFESEENVNLVVSAYQKVGKEGIVLVKEGKRKETLLDIKRGFILNTSAAEKITFENPYLLIVDYVIQDFTSLLPILEQVVKDNRPLFIVAEDFSGEIQALIRENVKKKVFRVATMKAPGIGRKKEDTLQDLAIATGTIVLKKDAYTTLEDIKLSDLGRASEVRMQANQTIISGGKGKAKLIHKQIMGIKDYIEKNETQWMDQEQYLERIGMLSGKIAVIEVGGYSLIEMHEEAQKIQVMLNYTREVLKQGVFEGGYQELAVLAKIRQDMLEEKGFDNSERDIMLGERILLKALQEPFAIEKRQEYVNHCSNTKKIGMSFLTVSLSQSVSTVFEWLSAEILLTSTKLDKEDLELLKKGVPVMR